MEQTHLNRLREKLVGESGIGRSQDLMIFDSCIDQRLITLRQEFSQFVAIRSRKDGKVFFVYKGLIINHNKAHQRLIKYDQTSANHKIKLLKGKS